MRNNNPNSTLNLSDVSLDEIVSIASTNLSGLGTRLEEIESIHSRILRTDVSRPCLWFVPVSTTEANTRLLSCPLSNGSIQHLIIWDERHFHFVSRIIALHEVWSRMRTSDPERFVKALYAIGLDYVLEQLCSKNRVPSNSSNPILFQRVLARAFRYCIDQKDENDGILQELLLSQSIADPEVAKLLGVIRCACRSLTLDHEIYHYLYAKRERWDAIAPVSFSEMRRTLLDDLSEYEGMTVSGGYPRGRVWSFFGTVLQQVPFRFLRESVLGTALEEEIIADLWALRAMLVEAKKRVGEGCTEEQEFRLIETCYRIRWIWQTSLLFLQGLRIEVGRSIGRNPHLSTFGDSDLGLRLMLGNFMCYKILMNAPYGTTVPPPIGPKNLFAQQIENTRRSTKALYEVSRPAPEGFVRVPIEMKHRSSFIDLYEKSNWDWIWILNRTGVQIHDRLKDFSDPNGTLPAVPSLRQYEKLLGELHARV